MNVDVCKKCKHSFVIRADRFGIYLGCDHMPYKGKWVVEIDKCPKDEFGKEQKNDKRRTNKGNI